jgi:hypothetical protein
MNGQIFISYRREDASYPAGRACTTTSTAAFPTFWQRLFGHKETKPDKPWP